MKKIYQLLAYVATAFLMCSCGEQKITIPLYEVENGDTIEVQHEMTASEISAFILGGYQTEAILPIGKFKKEDIPDDIELLAFLTWCEIEADTVRIKAFKSQAQSIDEPSECQLYVCTNDENSICIYL